MKKKMKREKGEIKNIKDKGGVSRNEERSRERRRGGKGKKKDERNKRREKRGVEGDKNER